MFGALNQVNKYQISLQLVTFVIRMSIYSISVVMHPKNENPRNSPRVPPIVPIKSLSIIRVRISFG